MKPSALAHFFLLFLFVFCFLTQACSPQQEPEQAVDESGFSAPTKFTRLLQDSLRKELDLQDAADFAAVKKGLLVSATNLKVVGRDAADIWNLERYQFLNQTQPESVNPSLWRQSTLNSHAGLYEVTKGIYQLRGFDLANMTLIEGETGWIVVDPLTAQETAAAALQFAHAHLPPRPITAVLFTHSHVDHFGGVHGLFAGGEVPPDLRVVAPQGFMEEATSENVIAGVAMSRRAMYMYGKDLPRGVRGHVSTGLGISPAYGTIGILHPTDIVSTTPSELKIDGVQFIFQNAPGSEAPAELTFYLPQFKAIGAAEVVSRTLHNLYTLRGAKVRDALVWADALDQMLTLYVDAEVLFGGHHWPVWGQDNIEQLVKTQRDTFRYIHDQTVRMFNNGATPDEIAETLQLPASLRTTFSNRDYYGTVRHNARAVYQAYLGWYDGNPAHLNPLPAVEAGRRYVDMMGGKEEVVGKAQRYFDQGEYRWVAELLNHVVFADPDYADAKALLANTYDQLGYQSESGPWRDVYLSAAYELRHGTTEQGLDISLAKGLLQKTPLSELFKSMSVRLNGPKAEGKDTRIMINFTDLNERYLLQLENAVLHYRKATGDEAADATLSITHDLFIRMIIGEAGIRETLLSDALKVEGSALSLIGFFTLFDNPDGRFNIVTP